MVAAILNILQVVADQAHLMQPEIAPFGYLLLEDAVVLASLTLGFSSWRVAQPSPFLRSRAPQSPSP
jgi:hypothetical protein